MIVAVVAVVVVVVVLVAAVTSACLFVISRLFFARLESGFAGDDSLPCGLETVRSTGDVCVC